MPKILSYQPSELDIYIKSEIVRLTAELNRWDPDKNGLARTISLSPLYDFYRTYKDTDLLSVTIFMTYNEVRILISSLGSYYESVSRRNTEKDIGFECYGPEAIGRISSLEEYTLEQFVVGYETEAIDSTLEKLERFKLELHSLASQLKISSEERVFERDTLVSYCMAIIVIVDQSLDNKRRKTNSSVAFPKGLIDSFSKRLDTLLKGLSAGESIVKLARSILQLIRSLLW